MAWLDTVLAVPAIGLRIVPNFRVASQTAQLLAPLVDDLQKSQDALNLQHDGPWDFKVRTPDGLRIVIEPNDILVRFVYPRQESIAPGRLATISQPEVRPYRELLTDVKGRLRAVLECLLEGSHPAHSLSVTRFGVVAATSMPWDQIPPGLNTLVENLGRSWGKSGLKAFEGRLLATIVDSDGYDDRCHHEVKLDEQRQGAYLSLDYQRYFKKPQVLSTASTTMRLVEEWCSVGEEYMERFGAAELENVTA